MSKHDDGRVLYELPVSEVRLACGTLFLRKTGQL